MGVQSGLEARFQKEWVARVQSSARMSCIFTLIIVMPLAVSSLRIIESPLEPLQAIYSTLQNILDPGSWFFHSLVFATIVIWTHIQAKQLSIKPTVKKSLLKNITQCLKVDKLQTMLAHGGFCVILNCCWIRQSGGSLSVLRTKCYPDTERNGAETCWNHHFAFLVLAGAYTGMYLWCYLNFENGNYLRVPVVYVKTSTQVKLRLYPMLWESAVRSLQIMKSFYIIYILGGSILCGQLVGFNADTGYVFSPQLLAYFFALTFFNQMCGLLISSHLTVGGVQPILDDDLDCLLDGVQSKNNILHLLSLQRLASLVVSRHDVRAGVFQLSQPGGHPHNWNKLLTATNNHLATINQDIRNLISPPPPKSADKKTENGHASVVSSPNIRRLAPLTGAAVQDVQPPPPPLPPTQRLSRAAGGVWEGIKQRPAIAWLVSEPTDVSFREIFCNGQPGIYSAEILSHLVKASLAEDRFGVVQKDLGDILRTLMSLEASIDRCRGPGVNTHRKRSDDLPDFHLKLELKSAVKSALYRITASFGDHILAVPLEPEYKAKLRDYNRFLES